MKRKYKIIIAFIVSIIVSCFLIPIEAKSTLIDKTFYGRSDIISLVFKNNSTVCFDCFNYNILWLLLIIEFISIFSVTFMVLNIISKRSKK